MRVSLHAIALNTKLVILHIGKSVPMLSLGGLYRPHRWSGGGVEVTERDGQETSVTELSCRE
jgi:hypothetical protein